jgi:uncharacterized protein
MDNGPVERRAAFRTCNRKAASPLPPTKLSFSTQTTAETPIANQTDLLQCSGADRAPLALVRWTFRLSNNVMSAASDVSGAGSSGSLPPPKAFAPVPEHPIELQLVQEDTPMTFSSFHLMQYHQKLDSELRAERARRWPDVFRIQKLKRLKLAVKDRLVKSAARTFGKRLRLQQI